MNKWWPKEAPSKLALPYGNATSAYRNRVIFVSGGESVDLDQIRLMLNMEDQDLQSSMY